MRKFCNFHTKWHIKRIRHSSFLIKSPTAGQLNAVNVETMENGDVNMSVEDSGTVSTTWMDGDGNTITHEKCLSVRPIPGNKEFRVAAIDSDGELGTMDISLDAGVGIKSIDQIDDHIDVTFLCKALDNSVIVISQPSGLCETTTCPIKEGDTSVSIDISSIPDGICIVSYLENNILIDQQKFIKK